MPILFVSLNEEFIQMTKKAGFESYLMKIDNFKPNKKTYYMSPANSLGFMDGGIDLALSRDVMPGIEQTVKKAIKNYGKLSRIDRMYLPIGSSIIISYDDIKNLVVAPTMLLPQDINNTDNVYWAVKSCLFNILVNKNENINDVDIILTSSGCGFGKLSAQTAFEQTMKAIKDYSNFSCSCLNSHVVIAEPNLSQQPKIYMNHEFIDILNN